MRLNASACCRVQHRLQSRPRAVVGKSLAVMREGSDEVRVFGDTARQKWLDPQRVGRISDASSWRAFSSRRGSVTSKPLPSSSLPCSTRLQAARVKAGIRWSISRASICWSVLVKNTGTLDALSEAMRVSWSCIA